MMNADVFTLCLGNIYPCAGLIYVGAGNGIALANEFYAGIPKLLAVEADDQTFRRLERSLSNHPGWFAKNELLSDEAKEISFHVASNPNESGLLAPELLKPIWRNLSCNEIRQVSALTLSMLLKQETDASAYNWLRIDCLPAVQILKGLAGDVDQFDVIDIRILAQSSDGLGLASGKTDSDAFLVPLGYRQVYIEEEGNQNVLRSIYVRDSVRQFAIQTENLRQVYLRSIDDLKQENFAVNQNLAQLENEKVNCQEFFAGQVDQMEQLKLLVGGVEKVTSLLNFIKGDVENFTNGQNDLLANVRMQVVNGVGKIVANSSRQVCDFISLERFFESGVLSDMRLETNGWPACTDFIWCAIKLIEKNSYDLIIEFGSGVSTLAIAKSLSCFDERHSSGRIPLFFSFDHLDDFMAKTKFDLESAGVAKYVNLVLAPLVEFKSPSADLYSYYDCAAAFGEMLSHFEGAQPNILVVVDGPPAKTGKHARYPAWPIVKSFFSQCDVAFLVDDTGRTDDREVVDIWSAEADGYSVNVREIDLEKGCCLITFKV